MVGIYLRRSVHLSQITLKIPSRAKLPRLTRRLTRFLDNPAIRVRGWFEPIAQALLQPAAATVREIRLIADGTKVSLGHPLLVVSLAFRRRAIPIAWTWVKTSRGTVRPSSNGLYWLTSSG